jgi:hypothetical protein
MKHLLHRVICFAPNSSDSEAIAEMKLLELSYLQASSNPITMTVTPDFKILSRSYKKHQCHQKAQPLRAISLLSSAIAFSPVRKDLRRRTPAVVLLEKFTCLVIHIYVMRMKEAYTWRRPPQEMAGRNITERKGTTCLHQPHPH